MNVRKLQSWPGGGGEEEGVVGFGGSLAFNRCLSNLTNACWWFDHSEILSLKMTYRPALTCLHVGRCFRDTTS